MVVGRPELLNLSLNLSLKHTMNFYLNNGRGWRIELMINGDGVKEHLDRFDVGGKYHALNVKDYILVDFRGNSTGQVTNIARHAKRLTVFFKKGDFSIANCCFGNDEFSLELAA